MLRSNNKQSTSRNGGTQQQSNASNPPAKSLRILDYRNGKYQGFTTLNSYEKNGLGILIDDNYSFIMSEWKQNKIQGPVFMVYPDESILYGYIEKQKIGEFVCYEVKKEFNMVLSKNTNVILVDLIPSSSILVFNVDKKFLDDHTLESIFRRKQQMTVNQEINSGFELVSQQQYANPEEKYKIYQKKLSLTNVPQYLKNYQLFIHEKFNSTPQRKQLIQIMRSREDLTVNFKTSTITLFIKLYLQSNRTKMLGSMNRYQNQYEFYRKIMHNSNSVQEFVTKEKNPFTAEYNLRPYIRPKQCAIELCNFHRGSITYVNQFINLNYMNVIKQNLEKIHQLINIVVTNKFAQVQLQNSRYQNQEQDQTNLTQNPLNYTLEEVQQQIYDAVNRKRQSTGKKLYTGVSPSRVTEYPTTYHKSNEKYSKSQTKFNDPASKNNSPYLKALQNQQDIYESRLNRSKSYLNVSNISKNAEVKATPTKNTPSKPINQPTQQTTSTKKYAYLDDVQVETFNLPRRTKSPPKFQGYQNIRRLTEDYENIQRQIESSIPQDRYSKTPSRLDNSVYRKSAVRTNDYDIYGQSSGSKNVPLSQRKIFKYLPN